MTTVTFRYIDWISQNVVNVYETERDRWLENRSRIRSVRVAEILEGGDIDIDAMTSAIRYPLRRTHVALVLWFANDSNTGNELARLERCLRELAEHLDSGNALFVEADRVSGWGWIPLADAGGDPTAHKKVDFRHPRRATCCRWCRAARGPRISAITPPSTKCSPRRRRSRTRGAPGHRGKQPRNVLGGTREHRPHGGSGVGQGNARSTRNRLGKRCAVARNASSLPQ